MDAENDNDQPNSSSASASITPSSSNNSSSSNLLGHLPMLPFMRSTDDDDHEDDNGVNDNDMMHEEPMPMQQSMAAEVSVDGAMGQQARNALASDASTSGAAGNLAAEPMQQQDHTALPPPPQALQPPSPIVASSSTLPREAPVSRNDIADTLDASTVTVQALDSNAVHLQQGEEEAERNQAAEPFDNDIQLDDNDNNDFDVDLNARNDSLAAASTSSASIASNRHQSSSTPPPQQQQPQQDLTSLDTSASGSAGTSGRAQPPTTLPLLLYQQPQTQQQTEESKHSPPSYDHHYHHHHHHQHHHHQQHEHENPREYHSHTQHPYQYPYDFASSLQQQKSSNGASVASTNNSSTMFGNNNSDRNPGSGISSGSLEHGAGNGSGQVVDRLKMLYPNVNENETPLPRCWSPHDKCLSIGLSQNNLRVQFKGKQNNDAASVRTAHPIPPACGIYYFEVKIISKGKNGYMGIGLTAQQFRMNRLPGWDKQSYGYHGDDGNSFSSSGHGQSYGPTFTTGDIIGCCVNFVNNTCFYTKNGIDLGIAFRDLPTKLYPTVGLQTPGEEVDANFGQEPFKFDQIEEMMKQMRSEMKTTIYDFPLPVKQGDPTTLLQKMVNSYLVHNGYSQTAEAFSRTTGQSLREDITSIRNRQKILKLVMSGRMGQAIEQTLRSYPGLLEHNKNLWFMLKCRQFIEMINGSDIEYCPSSSTNKTTTTNDPTPPQQQQPTTTSSTNTTCSAPNQTSVIQSTKSYQNGNTTDSSAVAAAIVASSSSPSSSSSAAPTTNTNATTTTANNNNNNNTNSNNFNSNSNGSSSANILNTAAMTASAATTTAGSTTSTTINMSTTGEANSSTTSSNNSTTSGGNITETTSTTNNAQNSSHITVINTDNDIKNQSNLVEHCSASGDGPTIGKNNNDNDFLNDVEMENNGHSSNGNICKNGNTNNFNDSIDADEEMDVDVSPSVRKYSHGIERILEFGKDLSLMGQQLEKESKMTDEERQMLEDAFSLIAYSNPWASPLGWQLCPTKRETVCRALNSAILESMNYTKWPPLEYCVAHANELLKVMAQASLGACAFVNITDVFPKN